MPLKNLREKGRCRFLGGGIFNSQDYTVLMWDAVQFEITTNFLCKNRPNYSYVDLVFFYLDKYCLQLPYPHLGGEILQAADRYWHLLLIGKHTSAILHCALSALKPTTISEELFQSMFHGARIAAIRTLGSCTLNRQMKGDRAHTCLKLSAVPQANRYLKLMLLLNCVSESARCKFFVLFLHPLIIVTCGHLWQRICTS